ncbi:MAG: aminotransferase class IV [Planctomycetaceae bacterium]
MPEPLAAGRPPTETAASPTAAVPSAAPAAVDIAWLDGVFVARTAFAIPAGDAGFVLGATVTEQVRTFGGRLFLPRAHHDRFAASLAVAAIAPAITPRAVFAAAAEVVRHNHPLLPPGADLGVVILATPGDLPAQHGGRPGRPRVAAHSFPLAFPLWAAAYRRGLSLRTVPITQVPESCWPLHVKCRSRMHYHLADRAAAATEPGARALLCHADGRVSETSTANVAIVSGGTIVTPPATDALPGISLAHLRALARHCGIGWRERSLGVADVASADEVLLTSTPSCVVPATRFEGRPVGDGIPGPAFTRLIAAWSEDVGVDIVAQAERFAISPPPPVSS